MALGEQAYSFDLHESAFNYDSYGFGINTGFNPVSTFATSSSTSAAMCDLDYNPVSTFATSSSETSASATASMTLTA